MSCGLLVGTGRTRASTRLPLRSANGFCHGRRSSRSAPGVKFCLSSVRCVTSLRCPLDSRPVALLEPSSTSTLSCASCGAREQQPVGLVALRELLR